MARLAVVLAALAPALAAACSHECPDVAPELTRLRSTVEQLERAGERDRERIARLEERDRSRDASTDSSAVRSDDAPRAADAALAPQAPEDQSLARFAAAAALTGEQTAQMKKMLDRAAVETRESASLLADALRTTPDQSERLRRQAIDRSAAIGERLESDLRGVLTASQFELYRRSFPGASPTGGGWSTAGNERR